MTERAADGTSNLEQSRELEELRRANAELRTELERVRTLAALARKAEADIKALIENTDDFVLFSDANALPVYFNQNYARAMKELLGIEMQPGVQPHARLNAEARAFWDELHRRALSGEKFKAEFPFEHEGRLRTFEVSYNPVRDGDRIVGFSEYTREVTESRNAEAELIAARDLLQRDYEALSEGMHDGFVIYELAEQPGASAELRLLAANAAFERITGASRSECVGRQPGDTFVGFPNELLESFVSVARTGEPRRIEHYWRERDVYLDLLLFRPRKQRCAAIIQDVSAQKHLDEQQRRSERLESIGVLAGGIAHDFNNILAAMLASIQLAQWSLDENSEVASILGESVRACERASQLTKQLITFARGGQPIKRKITLNRSLPEWVSFALRGSNVVERVELPADLWPLEADEGQLAQVVHNLVVNAAQAMPHGGTVVVRADNVAVDGATSGHKWQGEMACVRLTVSDHGAGIPNDLLARIFDPYFTTKSHGSGLGLATSYSIVRNHGGFISVHSKKGHGTRFEVFLPATKDALVSASEDPTGIPGGHERLLLMDDDDQLRTLAAAMLEQLGYTVDAVGDGAAAVEAYASSLSAGRRYDAVLLDLTVPGGMGGKETLERLLRIDPSVRALVMSGYSTDPVMANHADHGFREVVTKPFGLHGVSVALRRALDSAR